MKRLSEEIIEAMRKQATCKKRPCVSTILGYEVRCVPRNAFQPTGTFFLVNGCFFTEKDIQCYVKNFADAKPVAAKAVLNALMAVE